MYDRQNTSVIIFYSVWLRKNPYQTKNFYQSMRVDVCRKNISAILIAKMLTFMWIHGLTEVFNNYFSFILQYK